MEYQNFPIGFEVTIFRFIEEYKWDYGTVKNCMNRIFHLDYTVSDYRKIYTSLKRARRLMRQSDEKAARKAERERKKQLQKKRESQSRRKRTKNDVQSREKL